MRLYATLREERHYRNEYQLTHPAPIIMRVRQTSLLFYKFQDQLDRLARYAEENGLDIHKTKTEYMHARLRPA